MRRHLHWRSWRRRRRRDRRWRRGWWRRGQRGRRRDDRRCPPGRILHCQERHVATLLGHNERIGLLALGHPEEIGAEGRLAGPPHVAYDRRGTAAGPERHPLQRFPGLHVTLDDRAFLRHGIAAGRAGIGRVGAGERRHDAVGQLRHAGLGEDVAEAGRGARVARHLLQTGHGGQRGTVEPVAATKAADITGNGRAVCRPDGGRCGTRRGCGCRAGRADGRRDSRNLCAGHRRRQQRGECDEWNEDLSRRVEHVHPQIGRADRGHCHPFNVQGRCLRNCRPFRVGAAGCGLRNAANALNNAESGDGGVTPVGVLAVVKNALMLAFGGLAGWLRMENDRPVAGRG